MSYDHRARVALITGASTGLGKAMALRFARSGARVALNYAHNQARAEAALAELCAAGGTGILVRADARDRDAVERMVGEVRAALGEIDILVVNATGPQPQRTIEEYDWAFYQEMLDYFVKSPYLLTRACLGAMKAKRFGRILNIGSEVFDRGVGCFSAYVAAKGAQRGWTRSMARELAPFGITVNMLAPGWIPVERHAADPQEMKDAYLAGIPLGRWGVPLDVAHAADFLVSDEAGFITGQTLVVNGGVTVA